MIPLTNHNSEATAYLVTDYPYGYKLRCSIRYWIEYGGPKKGFRFVSQTLNPKTDRWNKAKASTYSFIAMGMFLDSEDHVKHSGLTEYSSATESITWLEKYHDCLSKEALDSIENWIKAKTLFEEALASGKIKISCTIKEHEPVSLMSLIGK